MTFDGVPMVVGQGAEVSNDVIRSMIYQALSRNDGIADPGDLKISATSPASNQVSWGFGGVAIRNREPGGAGQMYTGLNRVGTAEVRSTIAATGSSSGRSDLIVARVEDPQYADWAAYSDPTAIQFGPYIFPRVIPNVDPLTQSADDLPSPYNRQSMYALARIDMPANTAVVDPSYIKDLRYMSNPHYATDGKVEAGVGDGSGGPQHLTTAQTNWTQFPGNKLTTKVPRWATKAQCAITINNMAIDGPFDANTRISLGGLKGTTLGVIDYNGNPGTAAGFIEKITHATYATLDVRSLQGKTVDLILEAQRTFVTTSLGNVGIGLAEQLVFDVRYSESPV